MMAVDKLVDSTQLNTDLTAVANAIRTKGGGSASLAFPGGFVSAVQAIPTGITPSGTKQISITENGTVTEDVTNYASAEITVDVQGGATVDDLATGAWPIGDITLTVCPTRWAAFSNCKKIRKVTATYSAGMPGGNVFQASGITEFVGINVQLLEMSMFFQCSSLVKVTAPKSNWYNYQAFSGCANLEVADLGTGDINRGAVFFQCKKLNTLILRSTSLCALGNVGNFNNTPFHPNGDTSITGTGTLYVPASLVDTYKTATNWSTLYSDGTMDVLPIEGSIYETQYADGTPIT